MLMVVVQPVPSVGRGIVILVLFGASQKEAETEEHFIKNTTGVYRAAAGRCGMPKPPLHTGFSLNINISVVRCFFFVLFFGKSVEGELILSSLNPAEGLIKIMKINLFL